ncbi:uncharacterized protein BBA_06708 [Beauveria bassiana ARSEF 2860]|uniref:Uncharacterized protein n=1 Tax=Beauveria bassiana (strain ARSEF 2860) TaxID=655819 RepID=J5JMQ2_BEAB2|nr:uncharacterized protein BBA_06708 [Beauveria bassiana ARSEF 2860]EJP64326.1 hypothetical protein BBA_06708 [Beauveria bassiana ARSEF 2860]
MATVASATDAAQETTADTQNIGVTLYQHVNYRGLSYVVPSVGRCWALPAPLRGEVSSIRFQTNDVSCSIYKSPFCFPPALYAGLRQSVPDLHDLDLGDEVQGVLCAAINSNDE